MSPSTRPRLLAALALCLLAATATPAFVRNVVHFFADFDSSPQGPGSDQKFEAKGGEFMVQGPPNVFDLDLRAGGDSVLVVGANPFGLPAIMTASLDEPTEQAMVKVETELTPVDGVSDLSVTMIDDNSGGMIDLEFHDDGTVKIGPYVDVIDLTGQGQNADVTLFVTVVLRDPLVGAKTWQVTLNVPGVFLKTYTGVILTPGPMSLSQVRITRPGPTAVAGTWEVDDLLVTSPNNGSSSN